MTKFNQHVKTATFIAKRNEIIIMITVLLILNGCAVSMPFEYHELKPFQHYGYIIDKNNHKIEGLIELDAYGREWRNQSIIGFCPQIEIDIAKNSRKKTVQSSWYKSSQLVGYGFSDRKFLTLPIELLINGQVKTKLRILEVISEENKTFKFYESSDGVTDLNKFSIYRKERNGKLILIKQKSN